MTGSSAVQISMPIHLDLCQVISYNLFKKSIKQIINRDDGILNMIKNIFKKILKN